MCCTKCMYHLDSMASWMPHDSLMPREMMSIMLRCACTSLEICERCQPPLPPPFPHLPFPPPTCFSPVFTVFQWFSPFSVLPLLPVFQGSSGEWVSVVAVSLQAFLRAWGRECYRKHIQKICQCGENGGKPGER